MHTVAGPTQRVVIIGAGLGGLSAALHLAGAGREVTVVEREATPGGRAGRWSIGGYTFDTGPTVLTMPDILAATFAAVGERLTDHIDLLRLDPAYRAVFADGSRLDLRAGVEATAAEIAAVMGPRDAAGFERFAAHVRELYRLEMARFIDRNYDSVWALADPALARLVTLGGLRRLAPHVARFISDERLQRLLSFQAMYAGLSPYDALALYAVIAYMDVVAGVWFPRGGMAAVPSAMARVAEAHGVAFRYSTAASRIELSGDRATAVVVEGGERIPADVVVVNADLPLVYGGLLPAGLAPRRLPRSRHSPSCVVLHLGVAASSPDRVHHTIEFGTAWREVFADVIEQGRVMRDPSLLVTAASVTDPSLAPIGSTAFYVLAPTPNLDAGIDWRRFGPRYRDELLAVLERRGYSGLRSVVEVESLTTPLDWRARGMARGAPFSLAHTFGQTGPFRPGNLARGLQNVVFAGSATRPGVGVPMVLISGRLAAERITGRRV